MKNNERGLKGFLRSFRCAVSGIASSVVNERNIRIHLVAALYVLYFSVFYEFSRGEYILLLMTICLVICTEMLNTAIEAAVDLVTEEYARLAEAAKDIAAGAVLVMAAFSVFVGFMLFFNMEVVSRIIGYFAASPLRCVLLVLTLVLSVLFILKIGTWAKKADKHYGLKNGGNDVQNKK
ncbi:MAG: diacylglycerol kinase family protein [Acetanaerobacterium sp.]